MDRRRFVSRMASVLLLLLASSAAVFIAGCPQSQYHSAVIAEHDFKLAVQSFQQAETVEFQSGRIAADEHQKLEAGIEKVALAGQTLTTSLQAGAANTTVQQNFATVSTALTDLLNSGVLGIKNPTSQQVLKVSIQTAQAILSNVSSLLSVPTTTTLPAKTGGN
jgi:hypothetical protein